MLRSFLIALRFLTRLPVPEPDGVEAVEVGRSILFYPLAGVIIGLILVALNRVLEPIPGILHAALLLAVWVSVTGVLHLDGLADSADAWIGGTGDRERTLTIMKDPSCGAAALVVVVVVLIIKFAALQSLSMERNGWVLIVVPAVARTQIPLLFLTTPYIRPSGMGAPLAEHLPRRAAAAIILMAALLVLTFTRLVGLWLLAATAAVYLILRGMMMSRIGGTTGDTAGAIVELTETLLLAVATVA